MFKDRMISRRYDLAKNDGAHHLHGGVHGFNKKLWLAEAAVGSDACSVTFSYLSEDGEENYPGNLNVTVTYRLTDSNELFIDYTARTDRTTPVNLTNHAYWNLLGAGKNTILDHDQAPVHALLIDSRTAGNDGLDE